MSDYIEHSKEQYYNDITILKNIWWDIRDANAMDIADQHGRTQCICKCGTTLESNTWGAVYKHIREKHEDEYIMAVLSK